MAPQPFDVLKTSIHRNDHAASEASSSEGQIWIDFLRGDDQAVADLYKIYANKLFNYGHQFTKNEELILDAVQDVFLNLIRTRDKLSVATSVKFYLYASFRRTLVRQVKRSHKLVLEENMDSESFQIKLNPNFLSVNTSYPPDQKKIIEHFCNKLPSRQREAIVLHYFEDLNYSEIAKAMNFINSKSARTLVYRALDSLSKLLSAWKKELIVIIGTLPFQL
jgi:RNA polymerase sigma-70 factor (ECF subfamily)